MPGPHGKKKKDTENEKEKTFDQIDIEEAYIYAIEDADVTLKLYHILKKRIIEEKLVNVYENIEMGLGQIWESLSPIPFPPVTIHTKFLLSLIWYW